MIETVEVTGRTPVSWTKKINPWWWLWNDLDQIPDQWYMPGANYYWRQTCWWFRNHCANFVGFVIGVNDRNYSISGTVPVRDGSLADTGAFGWKWSVIRFGWVRLPFISYAGTHVVWYLGWRFSGGFGIKIVPRP